ncbi:MAG: RNA-binding protein [Bacteroidetes bacterium HGW-Bacteroidetes-2]|nr:MAG: RNA-binding protein [Bacteroidetes bacterium HGW-Bacteroidetes-2]
MNKIKLLVLLVCIFPLFIQCNKENKEAANTLDASEATIPLFEYLNSSETGIDFANTITENEQFNFLLYEYLYNGGGVAVGDINNDGLQDLYFSGNTVSNKLYLNQGNFIFKDITETANVTGGIGFKTGVTMVDVNNDGLLDIYVSKSALQNPELRRNLLYINNGDLTFTEKAADYGLDDPGYSVQAYFFDMDGDGDTDVYVLNHPGNFRESNTIKITQNNQGKLELATPTSFEFVSDRLYKNTNNKFTDISKSAGVLNEAFGLSAVIADFNNDNLPDIYVANDYVMPDRLLINQGNYTFKDELDKYLKHTSFSSMGSDYGDINNDGCLDLITVDMLAKDNYRRKTLIMAQNYDKYEKMLKYGLKVQFTLNMLQINSCTENFSDIAFMDGIAHTDWSWSPLLADFDNDGLKDIHITNGYVRDISNNDYAKFEMDKLQKQLNAKEITLLDWIQQIPSVAVPSFFFKNNGNLSFENASTNWNSGPPAFSNGSAYADLNNDGFLDLVVNNINSSPFIMKNKGNEVTNNNYLAINLAPTKGEINLGTIAKAYLSDGSILTEHYNPTRGFLSSSQHRLHFGIKENLTIQKVEIIWPDRKMQILENPDLNQILSVVKKPTSEFTPETIVYRYFEDASKVLPKDVFHKENEYIDFKREALLHHKYSQEGPAVSVSDVNGDGLEDMFLGGAMGFSGKLFLQNNKGTFTQKTIIDFEEDKNFEDVNSLFFDANGNGLLDLYVVSGGNEELANHPNYQDRLYMNDGKGNFKRAKDALPQFYESGAVVKAQDVDGDGQLDLFVGGRVTPGRNPETPKSYLLKNNNGKFTDVTALWSENLSEIGMITDAVFADLDNDNTNELILSGEWMPITVFKYKDGKYKNATETFGLSSKVGWWYSLAVEDINEDGFLDIVAGNLGLNSLLKATSEEPITILYNDFDNNGSLDAVLSYYVEGVSHPFPIRDRMLTQMVMLRKRFTRYEPYANAGINDIFTPQELSNAKKLDANHLEHTLFINNNGKDFSSINLPRYTQISTVKSIQLVDVNKDDKIDLLLGGNFYGTDAEITRYDASIGVLLLGDGKGNFEVVPPIESGFIIPGNVQKIVPIIISGIKYYWIVRNNDTSSLLKLK